MLSEKWKYQPSDKNATASQFSGISYSVIWTLWHESIYTEIVAISSPCVYFKQTHVALLSVKLGAAAWSRNKKVGLALWGLTCYSCEHLLKFLWGATQSGYQCQAKIPQTLTFSSKGSTRYSRRWKCGLNSTAKWEHCWSTLLSLFSYLNSPEKSNSSHWYCVILRNTESLPSRCLYTVLSVLQAACHWIISTLLWSRHFYMQLWANKLREWNFSNKSW